MLRNGDLVKLNKTYNNVNIHSGEIGEVKEVMNNGESCKVEFETYDGQNKGPVRIVSHVCTVQSNDLEKVSFK